MIKRLNSKISIRPLEESDKKEFLSMKIKKKDTEEILRCTAMSLRDYLRWHYNIGTAYSRTHVIVVEDKIVGALGITLDNNLFFFTEEVDRLLGFCMVKYFKEVLESLMDDSDTDEVYACLDDKYEVSKVWAFKGNFKTLEEIDIQGNAFRIISYLRQNVAN